jgi:hypothetical protein
MNARGGKKHNLTSTILKRLRGPPESHDTDKPPRSGGRGEGRRADSEVLRAAAVTAKLEEGHITAEYSREDLMFG